MTSLELSDFFGKGFPGIVDVPRMRQRNEK
jgi:hypothetical protein